MPKLAILRNLVVSSSGFNTWPKQTSAQSKSAGSQRESNLLVVISFIHNGSLVGCPRFGSQHAV